MGLECKNIAEVKWGWCCCKLRLAEVALQSTAQNGWEHTVWEQTGWCLSLFQMTPCSSPCCLPWRLISVAFPTRVSLPSGLHWVWLTRSLSSGWSEGRMRAQHICSSGFLLGMLLGASSVPTNGPLLWRPLSPMDPLLPHSHDHSPPSLQASVWSLLCGCYFPLDHFLWFS